MAKTFYEVINFGIAEMSLPEQEVGTMMEKILVLGAGAIGSYIGGSLAASGKEVVFFDRPETKEKLDRVGIRIISADNSSTYVHAPIIYADIDTLFGQNNFQYALIAVKSYDTEDLLHKLWPVREKIPAILSLQNGVENETFIKEILDIQKIIPASVTTAIGKGENNTIIVEKLRGIGIGNQCDLSAQICSSFNAAKLNCRLYENGLAMKWSKMLTNLTANALSAILDMAPAEILVNPALFKLEMQQIREALRVMSAYQIPVIDLPRTPVRAFAWIAKNMPLVVSHPVLLKFIASGRGTKMPSFHIDLASGRGKSEVDYLNGAIVKFGHNKSIPTPVNHFYTQLLMKLTIGEMDRSEFRRNPQKLIQFFYQWENQ